MNVMSRHLICEGNDKEKMYKESDKVDQVIQSITDVKHIPMAQKMIDSFNKKWGDYKLSRWFDKGMSNKKTMLGV